MSDLLKFLVIFIQFLLIYGFYSLGGWLRDLLHLPLPASIIGFLLLFLALSFKIIPLRWVESGAQFTLTFLSLYFIPATVGVIDYGDVFSGKGVWLIVIIMFSTLLTMAVAGLSSQWTAQVAKKEAK